MSEAALKVWDVSNLQAKANITSKCSRTVTSHAASSAVTPVASHLALRICVSPSYPFAACCEVGSEVALSGVGLLIFFFSKFEHKIINITFRNWRDLRFAPGSVCSGSKVCQCSVILLSRNRLYLMSHRETSVCFCGPPLYFLSVFFCFCAFPKNDVWISVVSLEYKKN